MARAKKRQKIKWNIGGFHQIRRLPKVKEILQNEVNEILDFADPLRIGYDGGVEEGRSRSRGYVVTKNAEGAYDNSQNATLVRALGTRLRGGDL